MREFFRSWKRKVGVVTLVLACLFTGIWIRGLVIQDLVLFGKGQKVITRGSELILLSASARDGFIWARLEAEGSSWLAGWQERPTDDDNYFDPFQLDEDLLKSDFVDYHWKIFGIEIGRYHQHDTFSFWRVSYASIVLPLTMLSAYLLLSKSPAPKPPRSVIDLTLHAEIGIAEVGIETETPRR